MADFCHLGGTLMSAIQLRWRSAVIGGEAQSSAVIGPLVGQVDGTWAARIIR